MIDAPFKSALRELGREYDESIRLADKMHELTIERLAEGKVQRAIASESTEIELRAKAEGLWSGTVQIRMIASNLGVTV